MALALRRLQSSNNALYGSLRTMRVAAQPASARLFNSDALTLRDMISVFPTRNSPSQIANMMNQFKDYPMSLTIRRSWSAGKAENGFHLRMVMRGLSKEDIKVSIEQGTLIIRVEGKKESGRIDLPEKLYKVNDMKVGMKNGMLKVFVPETSQLRRFVYYINDLIVK